MLFSRSEDYTRFSFKSTQPASVCLFTLDHWPWDWWWHQDPRARTPCSVCSTDLYTFTIFTIARDCERERAMAETSCPALASELLVRGIFGTSRAVLSTYRLTIGCQLLLIINRKSYTGFRLVPTSMTLNDLEHRNSPYFAFFHRIRQIFRPIISQWLKIDL